VFPFLFRAAGEVHQADALIEPLLSVFLDGIAVRASN
jgi:hypothetical protein